MILATIAVTATACKSNKKRNEAIETSTGLDTTAISNEENKWESLFDGGNLNCWKAFNVNSILNQWQVKDWAIAFSPAEGKREGSENLISKEKFTNFELSLEWKSLPEATPGSCGGGRKMKSLKNLTSPGQRFRYLTTNFIPMPKTALSDRPEHFMI